MALGDLPELSDLVLDQLLVGAESHVESGAFHWV
jgi:hypothetical protein